MQKLTSLMIGLGALLMSATGLSAQTYTPDILELDGANGLEFQPEDSYDIVGYGTVEFWVTPDWETDPGYDPVILSNAGEEGPSYLIALLRDRNGIGIVTGDREEIVAFDFTDGNMHHIAVNDYGDTLMVYIDHVLAGRFEPGLQQLPSSGVWIGTADGEASPFIGAIAGLRFWGAPVEPDNLKKYARKDIFAGNGHPDLDYLTAMSEFDNRDVVVILDDQ
ncbi:MAG: LamG domain-containing protein [Alphaproteobacteria bacterium]|nr:LamG domain-containing protein [Alphaproteobacteria bacterium]